MNKLTRIALGLALFMIAAPSAVAQPLPAVNLGFTSFLDGGPPAGPGFYFQEYIQYYTADHLTDSDGNEVTFGADLDLEAWVSLNQFIYQSDQSLLLGGKWGIDVILPIVGLDLGPATLPVDDNGAGIGDLLIGPYLQWDPIMGDDGPVFIHRIEFQNIVPTGKYHNTHFLNPGSNHYSFNPYWSATWWILPNWTASWRIHYLWNAENDDPWVGYAAADTQAGQAIHVNFATAFELLPKQLHVGVNGYYLKQITDSQINGADVPDSREQVLGIGPGAVYHFSPDDHIFVNLFFETLAENRPEGIRAVLRWTHHF
jgi:anthranilate 1,2-dioxygenase (deaminating, decarboxylating) large subunit